MILNNNSKKKLIGITGSIGTGKSTVSKYLIEQGYKVIDFDLISKGIYLNGKPAYESILEEFGIEILDNHKEIDRKKLGKIVFSDEEKMNTLNKITHNAIYSEAAYMISNSEEDILFLDIPLLYETEDLQRKYGIIFEEIWLVYSDIETQIERIMMRDHISYTETKKRLDSQMSMDEKIKRDNKVIFNDKDLAYAYSQVDSLLKKL